MKNLGSVPPNSLLVSMDAAALLPSIPHDDGLAALSDFLMHQGFSETRYKGVIFMHIFESTLAQNFPVPYVRWMFTDDIFFIWMHGEESLIEFIEFGNQLHPAIEFTYENPPTQINSVDINIKHDAQCNLYTDLYNKPAGHGSFFLPHLGIRIALNRVSFTAKQSGCYGFALIMRSP